MYTCVLRPALAVAACCATTTLLCQMMKRQVFNDHKVDVVGVALNSVPAGSHTHLVTQVRTTRGLTRRMHSLGWTGACPRLSSNP
jgi:hypothetical protein